MKKLLQLQCLTRAAHWLRAAAATIAVDWGMPLALIILIVIIIEIKIIISIVAIKQSLSF